MTAEATSDSGRSDRKGGGSLDESAHRSHTISGSEGARHKLHHSRGARSSVKASRTKRNDVDRPAA